MSRFITGVTFGLSRLLSTLKEASQGNFAALRKVQADKDTALLEILTPEEKLEYDLRLSQSAQMMRMRLGEFEPTEQEFRAMFKAQKAFDDQFGLPGMGGGGSEEQEQRESALQDLNTAFAGILGQSRYREYKTRRTARDHVSVSMSLASSR